LVPAAMSSIAALLDGPHDQVSPNASMLASAPDPLAALNSTL
jgi:hypothetical protein